MAVRDALNRAGALHDSPLLPEVARSVQRQGFDFAWALPYAHRAGVAESVNEWAAAEVTKHPNLIAGATFHPDDPDPERLVERALVDLGLRVVKLHCSVGNFPASDPRLEPLWRVAARMGVPVVVHAGRAGGNTASEDVSSVEPVLRAHPGGKLVLAHTGHPEEAAAIGLMRTYSNLYADLTPVWQNPIEVSAAVLEELQGRFLFGSDAPNNPMEVAAHAKRIAALGLSPETEALVMGGAAARLLQPPGSPK